MATYKATDLNTKQLHGGEFGEVNMPSGKLTPTTGTSGDIYSICKIPAGAEVHALVIANGDLDTGTSVLAVKIGYAPVDGVNPTGVDNYFSPAGDVVLASANLGKLYANFDPIKFEFDVFLNLVVTTSANVFAAAAIWAKVLTRNVGVK
ncbi:MAG: hypothetical protein ACREA9_00990 [Pyrinomonadaceae bacterium]